MKIVKRVGLGLLALVVLVAVGPPLFYSIVPYDWPDLPASGRRISVGNGLSVNAIDRGTGRPVVLVHGLPGIGQDWGPLVDELASRGHRVIAYDRIGYGRSDGRPEGSLDFTVEANARELLALIESEALEDVTVVGWSFGGPIAIEAVVRSVGVTPQPIARLVLVGTGDPDSDDAEVPPPPNLVARLILRWVGRVPPAGAAAQRAGSVQAFSERLPPDWWLPNLQANFAAPHTRTTWVGEMSSIGSGGEFAPQRVDVPTLLIHGEDDRLAPLAISEYIHPKISGSRLEVVAGGSHMLPITHAAQLAAWITAL